MFRRYGRQMAALLWCGFLATAASAAQLNLPRGQDVIVSPAVGQGLCVSNLFQSNMVLQRDKPIAIWGWADPGEKVTVTLAGQQATATAAADRSWKVTLAPMPVQTRPLTLTVQGKDKTLTLDNILVGDVWVLGGQSNMEFPIAKVENGELEIVSANFPNIRLLTIPAQQGPELHKGFPRIYQWSAWLNRHFRRGDWDVCSPTTVREMSAIGYVFARRLYMATQVPIGVIDTARGGTTVETWTPASVLRKIDAAPVQEMLAAWDQRVATWDPKADLAQRIQGYRDRLAQMKKAGRPVPANMKEPTDLRPGPATDMNRPGNCFAGMIAPLAGLSVKGVLFHQGFNNCFNGSRGAAMYYAVFPKMIAAWRAAFNDADLPFGILSLCTAGDAQTPDNFLACMNDAGPYIREAQYKTFLDLFRAGDKNIGFASCYDLRRRWYHPQLKIPAGERLARWALATQYGMNRQLQWQPPMLKQMKVDKGRLLLYMDQTVRPVDDGRPIMGFAVAGQDGRFEPANAVPLVIGRDDRGRPKQDDTVLVLSSPLVPQPTQFRYAWARSPMGNLQGGRDIPLPIQRSDDWGIGHLYEAYTGKKPKSPGELNRAENNALNEALQAADLQRRLEEAQALLQENKAKLRPQGRP